MKSYVLCLISYLFRQVCQQINVNKQEHQRLSPVVHRFGCQMSH